MTATGNEAVTLAQLQTALAGAGGGGSLKLLHSGTAFQVQIDYGDKGYILFILMHAGGHNLMEMAVCMEGMNIDFGYSPENNSPLYSVNCMEGRCFLTCINEPDIFDSVWGMEVETY